jgi:hypothetical protein
MYATGPTRRDAPLVEIAAACFSGTGATDSLCPDATSSVVSLEARVLRRELVTALAMRLGGVGIVALKTNVLRSCDRA